MSGCRWLLLFALGGWFGWTVADDGLGRLFTTPDERRAMEAESPSGGLLRLEGLVLRPDGEWVLWIDGRRLGLGEALEGGGRVMSVANGRVRVERAGRRWAARVGERFGEVR